MNIYRSTLRFKLYLFYKVQQMIIKLYEENALQRDSYFKSTISEKNYSFKIKEHVFC